MSTKSLFYTKIYPHCLLAVLVLLGIAMGTWQEIITPTLPNLKEKLNISYESIGRMMSVRSLGNVMVLVATGYLYDSFPLYVPYMMFGGCLIAGLSTIIIPWCNDFWIVALLFCAQSGLQNMMNNGGQLIILQTFKDKAIGKMQIYHLGYGIGGLMSGFISLPFLPKHIPHQTKITKYCKRKLESKGDYDLTHSSITNNVTAFEPSNSGSFEYIYLIAGLIGVSVAVIFLGFVSLKNPMEFQCETKEKESWLKKINPRYIAKGRTAVGVSMTILLFWYYFFYIFGLLNFLPYIVVYAIDPCKKYPMSQKTAAYLHSAVNGCFLLGRIFGSFVIDLHPTLIMLLLNSFNIIFVLLLLFFANQYALALWIGACGMRFCNSIVYPSGTSYANRYIIVTSSLISIAFLGSTTGVVMGQITGGYVIDNYPSYFVFYTCLGSMVLLLITIVTMVIIGKKIGFRNFDEGKVSSKVSPIELNKA